MDERVAFRLDELEARSAFRAWCAAQEAGPPDLSNGVTDVTLRPVWAPFWRVDVAASIRWTGQRGALRPGPGDLLADESYDWVDANGQIAVAEVAWIPAGDAEAPRSRRPTRGAPKPAPDGVLDEPIQVTAADIRQRTDQIIHDAVERGTRTPNGRTRITSVVQDSRMVTPELVAWPLWRGTWRFRHKDRELIVDGSTGEVFARRPGVAPARPMGDLLLAGALVVAAVAVAGYSLPAAGGFLLAAALLIGVRRWSRLR
jgi:hypothetical protein